MISYDKCRKLHMMTAKLVNQHNKNIEKLYDKLSPADKVKYGSYRCHGVWLTRRFCIGIPPGLDQYKASSYSSAISRNIVENVSRSLGISPREYRKMIDACLRRYGKSIFIGRRKLPVAKPEPIQDTSKEAKELLAREIIKTVHPVVGQALEVSQGKLDFNVMAVLWLLGNL